MPIEPFGDHASSESRFEELTSDWYRFNMFEMLVQVVQNSEQRKTESRIVNETRTRC